MRSIKDAFLEKVMAHGKKLQPGDPLDPQTRMGAIVDERQLERVLGYIEAGKKDGARAQDGRRRARAPRRAATTSSRRCSTASTTRCASRRRRSSGRCWRRSRFDDFDEAVRIAQRLDLRPRRRGVDARSDHGAQDGARAARRHRLDQLLRRTATTRCRSAATSSRGSGATSRATRSTSTRSSRPPGSSSNVRAQEPSHAEFKSSS